MPARSPHDHTSLRRRLGLGAAAAVAALGAGTLAAPAAQAADPVEINLVTMNDFHGRIQASAPSGGAAALATAVKSFRDANENTIFAAAGDLIGASTFESFIQQDEPTIDALNAAGLDVSAAGNHEFDAGWYDLRDRVQGLADWDYISANVWDTETDDYALAPYSIEDVAGVRVGFIGAVTEALPSLVNPSGIATLDVRPIVSSVNAVADELSDGDDANGEADVLVLLIHEGAEDTTYATATDPTKVFGAIVNGVNDNVNAIVSGHTHLAYSHEVPYGGDTGLRPVISSGQYGEKFSNLEIEVDPDTKQVLSMANTPYAMYRTEGTPPATTQVANYAPDPTVAGIVASAVAEAEPLGAVPLGEITADFNRGKTAVGAENRGTESTIGNLVADAQLWAVKRFEPAAEIAFMNPGGLRTDMVFAPDGVLTYREAALVQPFANTLVSTTLTGDQIKAALEQQWQPAGAARPYLKLGVSEGLTYTYDPAAAVGARVSNVQLNGVAIDPAAGYRVVINSFLASGGDNFAAFAQGTGKTDTGQVDLQAMVDYMAFVQTASPDYAQRSIGLATAPAPAGGYAQGSTFELSLSALEFTTTEPKAGTVSATIGGQPAGSAPIDPALSDGPLDTAGTATLTVTVPAGVSGVVPLTLSTPTGTSITVPITVAAPIVKVASTTIGWPSKLIAKKGATVSYTAVVSAKGEVPTGTVTIYDGKKAIATATLTADDNGRVTVKLPSLGRGLHKLNALYSGDEHVKSSRSVTLPLLIL